MSRAAVFLDRDGVINRAPLRAGLPHSPACLEELEILPDVPAALASLKAHGFPLVVVTNQPDVARGRVPRRDVEDIHARLDRDLGFDAILCCFHDGDACDCRKPKPGLLLRAAGDLDIDLSSSFMVGDRWSDIEAGKRAGCRTLFVDRGYDEARPAFPDHRVGSLGEAAATILAQYGGRAERP